MICIILLTLYVGIWMKKNENPNEHTEGTSTYNIINVICRNPNEKKIIIKIPMNIQRGRPGMNVQFSNRSMLIRLSADCTPNPLRIKNTLYILLLILRGSGGANCHHWHYFTAKHRPTFRLVAPEKTKNWKLLRNYFIIIK